MLFNELKWQKTIKPIWYASYVHTKMVLFIWELKYFRKSCSVFQVFWTKNFAWGSGVSQNHDSKIAKLWTLRGKAKRAPIFLRKKISDFFYKNRQNLYGFGQNKLFGRTVNKKNHPKRLSLMGKVFFQLRIEIGQSTHYRPVQWWCGKIVWDRWRRPSHHILKGKGCC